MGNEDRYHKQQVYYSLAIDNAINVEMYIHHYMLHCICQGQDQQQQELRQQRL